MGTRAERAERSDRSDGTGAAFVTRLLREPLFAFLVPALAIFLAFEALREPDREVVRVTPETVSALVENRELVLERALLERERRELVDAFIEEEILVREAVARGLHLHDPRVRARLAAAARFLLQGEDGDPTPEDLERVHREAPERYLLPPAVSFEHVFFTTPPESEATVLAALREGREPSELGDHFWLGSRLDRVTEAEIAAVLGAEFAARVMGAGSGTGEWSGPYRSPRGTHWLRVLERHAATAPSAAALDDALRQEFRERSARRAFERELDVVRARYEITRADATAP
jgi:hypothetical protein